MALSGFPQAWLYVDPPSTIFTIPIINHPLTWYGFFFVLGLFLSFLLVLKIFERYLQGAAVASGSLTPEVTLKELPYYLTDKLSWYMILGIILGARFGHVVFYEWPYYSQYPGEIVKIWKGGLASHGGVIGIFIALYFYMKKIRPILPDISYVRLMDILVIPAALTAGCIRIGNFFNQEILGNPTDKPWGMIFGHPADGGPLVPRHPMPLYEAATYFIIFFILLYIWKTRSEKLKPGILAGYFLVMLPTARFILEFWKAPQSLMIDESYLQTGQILGLPMIALGIFLLMRTRKNSDLKGYS